MAIRRSPIRRAVSSLTAEHADHRVAFVAQGTVGGRWLGLLGGNQTRSRKQQALVPGPPRRCAGRARFGGRRLAISSRTWLAGRQRPRMRANVSRRWGVVAEERRRTPDQAIHMANRDGNNVLTVVRALPASRDAVAMGPIHRRRSAPTSTVVAKIAISRRFRCLTTAPPSNTGPHGMRADHSRPAGLEPEGSVRDEPPPVNRALAPQTSASAISSRTGLPMLPGQRWAAKAIGSRCAAQPGPVTRWAAVAIRRAIAAAAVVGPSRLRLPSTPRWRYAVTAAGGTSAGDCAAPGHREDVAFGAGRAGPTVHTWSGIGCWV